MKGYCATDAEIQDSFQNIKKHSMVSIQALNNFSFLSLRAWKDVKCGQVSISGNASE